ncbi:F0F1 ATP synthase subunit delta [Bordetella sp. FB-8]|uniref:F0F1 ATP synthase subunit delta n=1 Tax=Bordetella sp. FB-8 TaxID=1159870 RepID=UPI000365C92E|nr:F0F1 ATP synthase subunit delta [Bordetella sp. FB-8]
MAELSTVARPYAEALFQAASDDKALGLSGWADLIGQMAQIAANPDVREAMSDPRLDDAQRVQVFSGLLKDLKDKLSASAGNFIELLVQNDRLLLLPEIAEHFIALKNRHEGSAQAEITSAFELSEAQVKDLVASLEGKFGLKLKPHVTVDPSLIGGVRVAVGDQVLDTSVQAQLTRMRDMLAA